MEDKKKVGLIVTLVTVFLCGCPGLCSVVFGVLTLADADFIDTSGEFQIVGAGLVCLGMFMTLIPIGAGIFTFLQAQKEKTVEEDIGEIPPPL